MLLLLATFLSYTVFSTEMILNPGSACHLSDEGVLRCWGSNNSGIIPDKYPENVSTPHVMNVFPSVRSVSMNDDRGCAVSSKNEFKCWGEHPNGSEREGFTEYKISAPAVAVSLSDRYACVVTTKGGVDCMDEKAKEFKPIPGLSDVKDISVSHEAACALTNNGEVYCWGVLHADLNLRTNVKTENPTKVKNIPPISALSKSYAQCGLTTGRKAICWIGTESEPQIIETTLLVKSASMEAVTGCAALVDGSVECWGGNRSGIVPNFKGTWMSKGEKVEGISDAEKIFFGDNSACAELSDKAIKCWAKGFGFLGNSGKSKLTPYNFVLSP